MRFKFPIIQKITIAAMLVVLDTFFIALSKFSILPGISYVRLNVGPMIVIFSSILLGPLYGGIVGALGDLLGMLIAPIGIYNPFMTVISILYGVLPWLLMLLTRKFRTKLKISLPVIASLVSILIASVLLFYLTDLFDKNYGDQSYWIKPVIISALSISIAITIFGIILVNKKFQKNILEIPSLPSPNEIGLICIFVEVLLGVFANSAAILFYFHVLAPNPDLSRSIGVILPFYLCTCPFEILIETLGVSWLSLISTKLLKRYISKDED